MRAGKCLQIRCEYMHRDGVIAILVIHPVLDHFAGDAAKIGDAVPVVEKNWNHLQVITIRYLQRGLEICGDSLLPRRIRASIGIEGKPETDGIDAGEIFLSLAQFPMKEFGLELPPDDKPTGLQLGW